MIIGFAGAGKSTLARKLGEKLNIEQTYLDALFWKPGWSNGSYQEVTEKLNSIISREKWIIDGRYNQCAYDEQIALADTIIMLDINRFTCFYSAVKRSIVYRKKSRPCRAEGYSDGLTLWFVSWVLYRGRRNRQEMLNMLKNLVDKRVVILKTRKQVNEFVANL